MSKQLESESIIINDSSTHRLDDFNSRSLLGVVVLESCNPDLLDSLLMFC